MKNKMKMMKKLFAIALVAAMVMALCVTAMAATTGSITIKPPANATGTNTYKIYKVFDGVGNGSGISYKLMSGKSAPLTATDNLSKFDVDSAGNVIYYTRTTTDSEWVKVTDSNAQLSEGMIEAIGSYIAGDKEVATATSTGTANAVAQNLANGYYYITTSTGSVVTIDSTNPSAEVNDKNTVTIPHKTIYGVDVGSFDEAGQKALAQLGTDVDYEVAFEVGEGAKNYIFHDKMGTGLTYNNDVAVYVRTTTPATVEGGDPTVTDTVVAASNYTTTVASGDTITVTFNDTYIASQVGKTLVVKYSGKINSNALTIETGKNTASISYGDNNTVIPAPETPQVYSAKLNVTKTFSDKTAGKDTLPAAGFVVAKTVADTSAGAAEGATKTVYYKVSGNAVTWVDSIDDADVHTSDTTTGVVPAFTGLANGTYTLIEKNVPEGYNKAADKEFTINNANADLTANSNDVSETVLNQSGTELPSTGGIGTKIFYGVGAVLVIGAGVVLMGRKRAAD